VHRCIGVTDTPLHLCASFHDFNTAGTRPQHQRAHKHLLNMPSPPLPTPRLHPHPTYSPAPCASSSSIPSPDCSRQARRQFPSRLVLGLRPNPFGGTHVNSNVRPRWSCFLWPLLIGTSALQLPQHRPETWALPAADAPRGHASIHDRRDAELARHDGTAAEWHNLSPTPLSAWYARRLAAAKEPPVELAGMSELRQRRSVLANQP
jgi:hypothetical protein